MRALFDVPTYQNSYAQLSARASVEYNKKRPKRKGGVVTSDHALLEENISYHLSGARSGMDRMPIRTMRPIRIFILP